MELEGEGWDDTGPFRIEGALRHDGVSDERYFSLDAVYIPRSRPPATTDPTPHP